MKEIILIAAVIGIWILLQTVVFPKLGIKA